jgi:HSP20 family protein
MPEPATRLPIKDGDKPEHQAPAREWRPFENLRREMERVFEEFDWRNPLRRGAFDLEPLWRREFTWTQSPAVDVVEKDKSSRYPPSCPASMRATWRSRSPTAR